MTTRTTGTLDAPVIGPLDRSGLGALPRPQVNLLPPEVRSRRALGRTKARLALSLIVVFLLLVLAFVYATFTRSQASGHLADQQAEIARLLSEQAKYAEVPQVKGEIAREQTARTLGTSTEVMWKDYVLAIQAVTPEGVSLVDLNTNMPTPIAAVTGAEDPLMDLSVGYISFTGRADTLPDVSAWISALDSIPGFGDATVTTAAFTDDQGTTAYTVSSTVQVNEVAFALRFATQDGQ